MNYTKLYKRASNVQRHDAQQTIKEFSTILKWRLDGKDSLLDVGTGTGDVLMDFLYPLMPKNFRKIVGADILPEMIQHCQKAYSHVENVIFKVLDIETKTLPSEFIDQFSHVTSFYCLHWVQDQRLAVKNMYEMLQVNGDCLLVFVAAHHIFEVYKIVSMHPKWTEYMKDVDSFISPLQNCKDPRMELCQMLEDAGFVDFNVEARNEKFIYDGTETMKNNITAVSPFIQRIPIPLHEEFLDEMIKTLIELKISEPNNGDYRFTFPYTLMVVYAIK